MADIEEIVKAFNQGIDLSQYDKEQAAIIVKYGSLIEQLFHGAIWESAWFRRCAGQKPYSIETKIISGEKTKEIYDLSIETADPLILKNKDTKLYLPPAINADTPWIKDYSEIFLKALTVYVKQ